MYILFILSNYYVFINHVGLNFDQYNKSIVIVILLSVTDKKLILNFGHTLVWRPILSIN